MQSLQFDMSTALTKAQKQAEAEFERSATSAVSGIVRTLFSDGRYGGGEGLAHEIIRKKIEEMVLSDDFDKRIERIAGEVIDEQMASALGLLLHAKTRKRVFTAVEGIDTTE